MASTEIIVLTDSLDERISNGVETVIFHDPASGDKLEIELGEANRKHFANHLEKLAKYIAAARKVESAKPVKKATAKADSEISKIREWAQANGFAVGDRGRIKAEIKDAYYAAQNGSTVADVEVTGLDENGNDKVDSSTETEEILNDSETMAAIADGENEILIAKNGVEISDADILNMMADIEAENGNVELADLQAKVDNN